jgi:hypothetical protein
MEKLHLREASSGFTVIIVQDPAENIPRTNRTALEMRKRKRDLLGKPSITAGRVVIVNIFLNNCV